MKIVKTVATLIFLNFGLAQAKAIPGFIEIEPYAEGSKEMSCANYSNESWRVDLDGDAVSVSKAEFSNVKELQIAGGKMVGENGGEWGGKLQFKDGTTVQEIPVKDGVSALYKLSESRVVVLTGTSHLSFNEGDLFIFAKKSKTDKWKLEKRITLSGDPIQSVMKDSSTVIFVSGYGLYEVNLVSSKVSLLKKGSFRLLYPNNLVRTSKGEIFVGMRHAVAHFVPEKSGYSLKWWVKKKCG